MSSLRLARAAAVICGAVAGMGAVAWQDREADRPRFVITSRFGSAPATSSRPSFAVSGLVPGARRRADVTLRNRGAESSSLTLRLTVHESGGSPALARALVLTLRERRRDRGHVLWRGALSHPVTIRQRGVTAGGSRRFVLELWLPPSAPDSTQGGTARIALTGSA